MPSLLLHAALAALAGPLAAAGVAKLCTSPDRLAWPFHSGVLRSPHGPRLVGAAESAAAVCLVLLPGRSAAALALVAYAVLTAAAHAMRGRRCACFGAARLAAVGRLHVGGNAAGAALAAVLLLTDAPSRPELRGPLAVLAAGLVAVAVLVTDRRRAAREATAAPCTSQVDGVHLYVSENCPACRALRQLLAAMEPARQAAVRVTVVKRGGELPPVLADMSVPCATAVDAEGTPVCEPTSGIGAVKALIDTITVGSAGPTRAR
jgi:hypothetical protein